MRSPWKAPIWSRLVRSVFRQGWPRTDSERATAVRHNLWLHILPARVRAGSLRPSASLGLGLITLYLFGILCVSGLLLMVYYTPSTDLAYRDMKDLAYVVSGGHFLRNVHRWSAHLMVLFAVLHLARVFCTEAYKKPREFNWVVGVCLLGLTLALSFTGYLLPWDQLSFWAITVSANMLDYVPGVGGAVRRLLLGGDEVGQATLLRFYVLHVIVLPTLAMLLVALHVWRVRKDGGMACSDPALRRDNEKAGEEHVLTWPHVLLRQLLVLQGTLIMVFVPSLLWNAPLQQLADPAHAPNPAKAPWYFLGLQEMVAHSAFWGGFVVPAVLLAVLLALPYVDTKPHGAGRWFSHDRRRALLLFALLVLALGALTAVGLWFRGPDWDWQWPWAAALEGEGG